MGVDLAPARVVRARVALIRARVGLCDLVYPPLGFSSLRRKIFPPHYANGAESGGDTGGDTLRRQDSPSGVSL